MTWYIMIWYILLYYIISYHTISHPILPHHTLIIPYHLSHPIICHISYMSTHNCGLLLEPELTYNFNLSGFCIWMLCILPLSVDFRVIMWLKKTDHSYLLRGTLAWSVQVMMSILVWSWRSEKNVVCDWRQDQRTWLILNLFWPIQLSRQLGDVNYRHSLSCEIRNSSHICKANGHKQTMWR